MIEVSAWGVFVAGFLAGVISSWVGLIVAAIVAATRGHVSKGAGDE